MRSIDGHHGYIPPQHLDWSWNAAESEGARRNENTLVRLSGFYTPRSKDKYGRTKVQSGGQSNNFALSKGGGGRGQKGFKVCIPSVTPSFNSFDDRVYDNFGRKGKFLGAIHSSLSKRSNEGACMIKCSEETMEGKIYV